MVGSRRNLLKLRNNAFRYFAIEGVVKGGSQEKKGRQPRMQDTRIYGIGGGRFGPPVPPPYMALR